MWVNRLWGYDEPPPTHNPIESVHCRGPRYCPRAILSFTTHAFISHIEGQIPLRLTLRIWSPYNIVYCASLSHHKILFFCCKNRVYSPGFVRGPFTMANLSIILQCGYSEIFIALVLHIDFSCCQPSYFWWPMCAWFTFYHKDLASKLKIKEYQQVWRKCKLCVWMIRLNPSRIQPCLWRGGLCSIQCSCCPWKIEPKFEEIQT